MRLVASTLISLGRLATFCLFVLCVDAAAYDYSEPMNGVPGLPLENVEMLFVLRFDQDELLSQPIWTDQVDGILVPRNAPSPIRIGAEALHATITRLQLGKAAIIEIDPMHNRLPKGIAGSRFILMGLPEHFGMVRALVSRAELHVTDADLSGDGFIVKPVIRGRNEFLLITSPVNRGVLYGAYEVEERTTKRGVPRIDDMFIPRLRYRGWPIHNHEVPTPFGVSGRWRYNMSFEYSAFWPRILLFKEYPELGGQEHRAEVLAQQRDLHDRYADVMKYGAVPALMFNPLTLQWAPVGTAQARKAMRSKYPDILAKPEEQTVNLCPSQPETRQFVASTVRELVETFPELGMIALQMCDEGGLLLCDCEKCRDYPYVDRLVDYCRLIIGSGRAVNPQLRFMLFGSGLTNHMAMLDAKNGGLPTCGMNLVQERLGKEIEGFVLMATTPPGGDVETWRSPNSTILGQGLETYYLFHWYEGGGPGIVGPISPVMSHLSWPLPRYLDKLRIYAAPNSGMVGGASPVAGMDVAWWYPDLDPHKYMKNWCRVKYGQEAGRFVYEALVDTDRITDAFWLDTKPTTSNSVDLCRWGQLYKPWATDMSVLESALGADSMSLDGLAKVGWMVPQAAQPEAFKTLRKEDMSPWLQRFNLANETAISERAEAMMAKAVEAKPDNAEIKRLQQVAKATQALVPLYRDYHLAMVLASVARNTPDGAERAAFIDQARGHLRAAVESAAAYKENLLPVADKHRLIRLKRDTNVLYIGGLSCIVREAAYLFDQEFGGDSLLRYFDSKWAGTEPGDRVNH